MRIFLAGLSHLSPIDMHINFTRTIKVLVRKVNINRKSFATETVDCGSHDDKPFIGRRHNLPSSNIVPWRQLVKRWINVFKSFKHSYSQWSYSLSILFIRVVWWTSCRTISPMNSICNFSFHCDSSISPLPQADWNDDDDDDFAIFTSTRAAHKRLPKSGCTWEKLLTARSYDFNTSIRSRKAWHFQK